MTSPVDPLAAAGRARPRHLALLGRLVPRSLAGWFAMCWGLFLLAALVTGAALVSLYRDSTGERLRRAEAALLRGCEAIATRYAFATAGGVRLDWADTATAEALTAGTQLALRDLPGVEGGLWRGRDGPLAYAYPTYEGGAPKTDLPAAELPRIRAVAEAAIDSGGVVSRRYDGRSEALLLRACPLAGPEPELAGWVMQRVVLFGGPAYLRAASALLVLTLVLFGSAGWLGWLLWGWSRRLRRIEAALGGPAGAELPRLAPTGQRDLDRMVAAVNGAAERATAAHRAAAAAATRAAEAERLAGLGRVAAGVAHEVRNPIAAMRLKAENALARRDPERMARALEAVLVQVARLERVARDLLGVARGGASLAALPVDVPGLLAGRVALFREQATAAAIGLEAAETAPPLTARLDAAAIEGALDNLIINALQATPRGGRVTLSASWQDGRLLLAVADTGRGVPEALRDQLFEPFVTGRPDGTGLGLALVREVAQAHGGTARVVHRPDGTTFELALPQPEPAWPPS